jgi:mRNA interferase YafQ
MSEVYEISTTRQFDKDLKLAKKRGMDIEKLLGIVKSLKNDEVLAEKNRDHALTGNYVDYRECHISPDWLLIYQKKETLKIIRLIRTGSHSDLF